MTVSSTYERCDSIYSETCDERILLEPAICVERILLEPAICVERILLEPAICVPT